MNSKTFQSQRIPLSNVSTAGLLTSGEDLELYKSSLDIYDDKARKILNLCFYEDGVITGSNVFTNVEMGNTLLKLRGEELLDPRRAELMIQKGGRELLEGRYVIVGLSLQSELGYIAKRLAEQIRERDGEVKFPSWISLNGLSNEQDEKSKYGLVLNLGDAEVIHNSRLSYENYGKTFDTTDDNGVPVWDKNGARTFYTHEHGLSQLILFSDRSNLLSYRDCYELSIADSNGWVITVGGL